MSKQQSVLVIEDDPLLRSLYQRSLQKAGYNVMIAEHGREGVEMIQDNSNKLDLVLLDIMMPVMDGLEFLRYLQAASMTNSIPIVVLSNIDSDDVLTEALELGAIDYLIKVDTGPRDLIKKIRKYI
jgi:DNA-binding response OmpR family regulator